VVSTTPAARTDGSSPTRYTLAMFSAHLPPSLTDLAAQLRAAAVTASQAGESRTPAAGAIAAADLLPAPAHQDDVTALFTAGAPDDVDSVRLALWDLLGSAAAPGTLTAAMEALHGNRTLAWVLPELAACYGVAQDNPHHKFEVFEHCVAAAEFVPASAPRLRLAMLVHDVGKPATKTIDPDAVGGPIAHFYGHEMVGAEMIAGMTARLRFAAHDRAWIDSVVRHHMDLYRVKSPATNGRPLRELMRDLPGDGASLHELVRVRWCDFNGKGVDADREATTAWMQEMGQVIGAWVGEYGDRARPPLYAHELAITPEQVRTLRHGPVRPQHADDRDAEDLDVSAAMATLAEAVVAAPERNRDARGLLHLVFPKLALSGLDVMQALGLSKGGPAIGAITARLKDRVLDDPSVNTSAETLAPVLEAEIAALRQAGRLTPDGNLVPAALGKAPASHAPDDQGEAAASSAFVACPASAVRGR
jgi:hypothetical protein